MRAGIVGNARDDGNIFEVLGGGADHGWAANIDVFNEMAEGDAGLGSGFLEGVEIYHDHVDGLNLVCGDCGFVLGIAADVEQSSVDARMQRFHAAIKHLRKTGEFADVFYRSILRLAESAQCRRWR